MLLLRKVTLQSYSLMKQPSLICLILKQCIINQLLIKYLHSLEQELTNYSCLFKGDTISINYQGRDYLIDIVDCKPAPQICVIEADIEVDFKPPLDYKEIPLTKKTSHFVIDEEEEKLNKLRELEKKFVRLDGKTLTEK